MIRVGAAVLLRLESGHEIVRHSNVTDHPPPIFGMEGVIVSLANPSPK